MLATLSKLTADEEKLTAVASQPDASKSKKRKAREVQELKRAVQEALDGNKIEEDIPGLDLQKVTSSASSKQAMIARVSVELFESGHQLRPLPSSRLQCSFFT